MGKERNHRMSSAYGSCVPVRRCTMQMQRYQSMAGKVTAPQREKEIAEFQRRIADGEEDVEVVVATRVPVAKWRKSAINRFRCVFIEARYLRDERYADLVLTKLKDEVHTAAEMSISRQLGNYAMSTGDILGAGGGDMDMRSPTTGRRVIRRPDTGLRPLFPSAGDVPAAPRLVVEVEFSNRSIPTAQTYCREYFDLIPELNAALLFKFFPRRADGTFACIAILYRRARHRVVVTDQVSFGTAPLETEPLDALDPHRPCRQLPILPIPVERHTPWIGGDNAFVRIPAADLFDGALMFGGDLPVAAPPDIFIDLWDIFNVVDILWN